MQRILSVMFGALLMVMPMGTAPGLPDESRLVIAQRFGGDKYAWSIDGNQSYTVHYPVSVIISARVTIPAGYHSTSAGHYFPKAFQGAPVAQATALYDNYGADYTAFPTIAVAALSNQSIILGVTRPIPSDLSKPCVVRYFLQLTGEY